MNLPTILDAGPLVDRRDRYHAWATARFEECGRALLCCEAVVVEACFLLRRVHGGARSALELVERGAVSVPFHLEDEAAAVAALMDRSSNVPMSLADACLVRMAKVTPGGRILTLDSDFRIYRMDGRTPLPAILPDA